MENCGGKCEVWLKGTSGCMATFGRLCTRDKCSFLGWLYMLYDNSLGLFHLKSCEVLFQGKECLS